MTPFELLVLVVSKLDSLGIPYMIGGSFASSAHGIPRSTQDADIVIDIQPEQAPNFVRAFIEGFFIDEEQVKQAVSAKRSFNVIHLETMFKVDFFVLGTSRYAREAFSRRWPAALEAAAPMMVATAEDTVLAKLDWYRLGGGVSDRQWRDITGVLKTQAERLDTEYLRKWAAELGVSDLLERAQTEAGTSPL